MEQIRKFFEKTIKITDQDWDFFSSKLRHREFSKKHLLLKEGQVENSLSFIETGICRLFVPKEDNDLTFAFAFDNSFVSGYDSFLTRQPSLYHIQTLTKTSLWAIKYGDIQEIYKKTKIGNEIGRHAAEELFLRKSRRELSLLSHTPEERYLKLFVEQPKLIEKIPLKYIASYIGVTPQALSRIRKRIS